MTQTTAEPAVNGNVADGVTRQKHVFGPTKPVVLLNTVNINLSPPVRDEIQSGQAKDPADSLEIPTI